MEVGRVDQFRCFGGSALGVSGQPEALGFEVVERIADIEPTGMPTGGDDGGKALKANSESGGEDEFGCGEEVVFNQVDDRKKEEGFMRGKAFRAGAQFSVGGRIELLKSGEEVNSATVRKMGMTRKRI
jgi:hypothetical protein